jgi:serine/threonine-protein kinase
MDLERLGKYEIKRTLGRGAMGVVYEGYDPIIARRVAIKTVRVPDPDDVEAHEDLARFQREAQAAGRLSHPNIVGVFDTGEADGVAYIVMEFVSGATLKSFLDRGDRFTVPDVARIMTELLNGLAYSHANGVIHRDIKPANVMMTDNGQIKLADFGVARIESSSMTQAGTMIGTPSYMSPEQFMGQTVDARTDLYSCGVLMYQLLTGEKPFEGSVTSVMHKVLNTEPPAPSALSIAVPAALDAVVAKAMAKRPEDRFDSASAFSDAIKQAMEPVAARPQAPLAPVSGFEDYSDATMIASNLTRRASAATTSSASAVRPPDPPASSAPSPSGKRMVLIGGGAAAAVLALGVAAFFLLQPSPPPVPAPAHPQAPPPVSQASSPTQAPAISPAGKAMMLKTMTKAKIEELVAPATCSVVHATIADDRVTLNGIASTRQAAAIYAGLPTIPMPAQDNVARFDGPYCALLTALNLYKGTILPPNEQAHVALASGAALLTKGQAITLRLSLPAYTKFLEIDYVSSNGTVYHLPPPKTLTPFIAPNTSTLPLGHVGPPYGTDMVLVIASAQQIFPFARPAEEPVHHFATALNSALDQMLDDHGITVGATLVNTAAKSATGNNP